MTELKDCSTVKRWDTKDFEFDYIAEHIFYPIYPVIAEDIVKRAGRVEGRLMDIGCGGGHLGLAVMEKTDFQGVFVDINETALGIARDRAGKRGLSGRSEFLKGNVEHLELPDSDCDLIISRGSYLFWDNLENSLVEIYRVLAPGGMTYIGGGMGSQELAASIRPKMQKIWPEWPAPNMKRSSRITNEILAGIMERHGIPHEIIDNEEQGRWIIMSK